MYLEGFTGKINMYREEGSIDYLTNIMEEKKVIPPKEAEKAKEKQLEQQLSKFKEADKEVSKIKYEEYDDEEEYAQIDLELSSEQDIYQKFTVLSRRRINQEIMSHLEDNSKYVQLYKPLLINVTVSNKEIDAELLKTIELMVERSLIKRITDLTIQIKQVRVISSLMVIFGLAAMAISIVLSEKYLNIFMMQEIFTIASWVFIWKSVEGLAFEQRKLSMQKYKLLQIYSADYESRL